jgi:transposase
MSPIYIGVDVSKESLQISIPGRKSAVIANCAEGLGKLLAALQNLGSPAHVICEATGGYEQALAQSCWDNAIAVSIVNPRQTHDYARSRGILAKTDSIDAQCLAQYGTANEPLPTPRPSPARQQLAQHLDWRTQLLETKGRLRNRLEHMDQPLPREQARVLMDTIDDQLKELEKTIQTELRADADMHRKAERLKEVAGVSDITSASLVAYMPELGTLNRRQAAALAGLAPLNNDSGKMKGKRFIRGGRHKVRKILYMAALVHSRFDAVAKARCQDLRARGKPWKVVMTAMMRHLLLLLNQMLKNPDFRLCPIP